MNHLMLVAFYPGLRFDGADFYTSLIGSAHTATYQFAAAASLLNRDTDAWVVHAVNGSKVHGMHCGEVAPQFGADDSLASPTR